MTSNTVWTFGRNCCIIKYADCIFTNSFHAVCFGALFQRDMYMFSRKYGGKAKDMCKVLGIENRYFADDMFVEREPIPYDEVNSRIACMKDGLNLPFTRENRCV